MPRILREVGGLVIAEDGPLVLVVDRGNGPPAVLAFVSGVVMLVFGGFGAVSLATAGPAWLGIGFLAVGMVAAAVTTATVRRIRRTRSIPVESYRPVAVFDRAARLYRDADGRVVAPLDAVTFHRRMQVGSSSPKLVADTPSGAYVLVRGNPFTGGLGDLDTVLTAAVAI
ncbi:hypothetical protein [Mycolicibacterium sphagni]|uniref:hypothetical protein n=1 Tax=Mycolicibacterium sphagni TaxID=1786 RepID=UPI0015766F19|nr:hypothetical protein [Mycolicibacterium sphagni]